MSQRCHERTSSDPFDHLFGAGAEEPGTADGVPQPASEDWLTNA